MTREWGGLNSRAFALLSGEHRPTGKARGAKRGPSSSSLPTPTEPLASLLNPL